MPSSEESAGETIAPTGSAPAGSAPDSPARMLELAALTADRLVAEAKAEAESLVSEARAAADGVMDRLADEKAKAKCPA